MVDLFTLSQLRELEADGFVSRQVFAEVPPRMEYALTSAALGLAWVVENLTHWWRQYKKELPAKPLAP